MIIDLQTERNDESLIFQFIAQYYVVSFRVMKSEYRNCFQYIMQADGGCAFLKTSRNNGGRLIIIIIIIIIITIITSRESGFQK